MENKHTYKYEIIVSTENELSNDDLMVIKYDFWARLQGYHTDCPEQLKKANIELKGKYTFSNNEIKQLLNKDSLYYGVDLASTPNHEYTVFYDTYDNDIYHYILARKINNNFEIILSNKRKIIKQIDKYSFMDEVYKLAKYFNCNVITDNKITN